MFTRIDIRLTGPICQCETQSLSWGITSDKEGAGIYLRCDLCKTELRVPNKKFVAHIVCEKPYPGTSAPTAAPTDALPKGRSRGRFTVFDGAKSAKKPSEP